MSNGGTPANRRPTSDGAGCHSNDRPSHLVPGDDGWRADKALIAELAQLNTHVTRYVLRHLDVDAGRAEPITVEDERALAERLSGLAVALEARADRRAVLGSAPLCVEGETTIPQTTDDDSRTER